MRLEDNVAIVTGGGGGLGEGISLCLAREGARVVVSDANLDRANAVAEKVRQTGSEAIANQADVRSADDCGQMVEAARAAFGRIDTIVCNAGVDGLPTTAPETPPLIENVLEADWDLVMDVNLKGVFLSCRAVVPYFKEQGSGRIINISSVAGRQGVEFLPAYAASKAGVISLTQSIALQLAPYHVNVNCICPGIIWTPMWERLAEYMTRTNPALDGASPEDAYDAVVKQMIPFGNPQTAEDIGNTAVFLASDEAKEITAQALNVCGGIRMN
ncbi:MAG TPA: SDR family NAD(P)-dependent oxidoreductase [Gammaproteobacteria bacterium]|jgi:NAD(P)-dependent dehydrogenase (short-subunit alcohol dehydrogenase family)|nr:SDR family NAD(P)-dependent oxidoreductase [Gammaproteobacteria bacterium]